MRIWVLTAASLLLSACGADMVPREMESFTVSVPEDWIVRTERDGTEAYLFAAPRGFTRVQYHFGAVEMEADPDLSLREWAHETYGTLKFNVGNTKNSKFTDGTVAGQQARILTCDFLDEGKRYSTKMIFVRTKERGIVMVSEHLHGEDEYVDDVEEIFQTFKLKG